MSAIDLLRRAVERFGYVLWRRDFMRYGVDPFLDVQRLALRYGIPLEIIFDVGANIGQTSHEALKAFPKAQIHAFEPYPECFKTLNSIKDSRLSAHQLAFGDSIGEVVMYEYGQTGAATHRNSLVSNAPSTLHYQDHGSELKVPCTTIDAFCKAEGLDRINLLKIDVEGFELSVLHGARAMLEAGKIDFIYAEFNDLVPIEGTTGGALLPLGQYLATFGMRFLASYTDFIDHDDTNIVVANALWGRRPSR